MATTGREQIAAAVVRRLNAAVKSRRLYGPGHPLRAHTASVLLQALAAFQERYGSFVLETHRDGLVLEGKQFEGGESVDALALMLYSAGVWQLVLMPGMTEDETGRLMDVFLMEHQEIVAGGGLAGILAKEQIHHARAFELRPGEEDPANISVETYHRMLQGSLSAAERASLLGVLRAGSEEALRLLTVIVERTKQASSEANDPGLGPRVYTALAALDRLIVDAPAADAKELLKNLAGSVTALDHPGKVGIHRTILQRAAGELSARALLSAMTSNQIARMAIPCLEVGEPPPQAAQVVNGLPFDPEKARDALTLVSQQTGRSFDIPPAPEELRLPPWVRNVTQDLVDFSISDAEAAMTDEQISTLQREPRIDDATLSVEHTLAMLHLVLAEDEPHEVDETLAALVADTNALIQQGNLDVAGTVLQTLDLVADQRSPKAGPARIALRKLLAGIPGAATSQDIWQWPEDHPLLACLRQVARTVGVEFAHALHMEKDPILRQAKSALLARLGDDCVDVLLPLLSDANPDVAGPIVTVLVQMGTPKSVGALRAIARHPNAEVRREAVAALGAVTEPDAQQVLLGFLRDSDPGVRDICLRQLKPDVARRIASDLAAMLMERVVVGHAELRIRIIDLLMRTGATEAIPQLRKLTSPFKVRRRDRDVARFARAAVAALQRGPVVEEAAQ
jgi:hypothetical protein